MGVSPWVFMHQPLEDNTMDEQDLKEKYGGDLKNSDLIAMYRLLVLTREFEMRVARIYTQTGLSGELPHLCVGEEAVGVGSVYALRRDDFVCPSLRGRSVILAKGASPSVIMAGTFGKATGPSKGKYSAHHMGDLEKGILAGSLIIGSQYPIAVGAGLAFKMNGTDQVCLCFFGDGASNCGNFHESLNLAAILSLPVIFICNNNLYAIDMPVEKSMVIPDISLRAQGYGMPGKTIDGNNVLEVYRTVKEAIGRARRGGGPSLIECKTYRLRPHCERYQESRPKEELEYWWERCPVKIYKKFLKDNSIMDEEMEQTIEKEVEAEINRAVKFAEESPFPQEDEIFEDVYANGAIKEGVLCMK
jgi:TPP-dependent pyruvate/acetoin dehydrogenase alpha subunit